MAEDNARLPIEILQLVFDNANRRDVVAASYVSQYWRLSARSHRLYTVEMLIRIVNGVDIAGQLQRNTRHLKSAPLPLDLKITIAVQVVANEDLWHELVNALVRAITCPGVRKLSLRTDGVYLDTVAEKLCDTPAPLIESLQLAAEFHRGTAPLLHLFAGSAPKLRDVNFTNVAIDSIGDSTAFASVQRMRILSCAPDISILFSACPSLQHLTLHNCDFKPSAISAPDLTCSAAGPALQKLEVMNVSRGPSDATLEAVCGAIRLSGIPTVRWFSDLPPSSAVVRGLLHGFPSGGLSLSLSLWDDWQNRHMLKLSAPTTASACASMGSIEARVREFVFSPLSSFTLWPWIGADRVARLNIDHSLLYTALPAVPAFCLPHLLEMRIQAPVVAGAFINFWDHEKDLARGRLLAPQLQRLTLFAARVERPVFTAVGLVSLATQVLGLSPFPAGSSVTTRPDLHMINLVANEQRAELLRLFNRIEIEELNGL